MHWYRKNAKGFWYFVERTETCWPVNSNRWFEQQKHFFCIFRILFSSHVTANMTFRSSLRERERERDFMCTIPSWCRKLSTKPLTAWRHWSRDWLELRTGPRSHHYRVPLSHSTWSSSVTIRQQYKKTWSYWSDVLGNCWANLIILIIFIIAQVLPDLVQRQYIVPLRQTDRWRWRRSL